jgi:hypothetical protein
MAPDKLLPSRRVRREVCRSPVALPVGLCWTRRAPARDHQRECHTACDTYHRCRGGDPGFGTFGRGDALFTVDPAPPATFAAGSLVGTGAPLSPLPILASVLAIPLFMLGLA